MGFFTHTELAKKAKKEIDIHSFVPQCNDCGLYKDSRTKKQGVTGSGAKRILIVGDFPSENDDYDCTQLSGEVGTYTKNLLRVHGNIVMNADCWKVNAIRCKPPEGLDTEKLNKFSKMCRPALEKVIFKLKPDYVLLLGRFAVQGVLGEAFSSYGIERWRGIFIKDEYYKTTLFATFHPRTYVTENNHDRGMNALIERDFRRFCTAVRSRDQLYTPKPDYAARVKILTDIRLVKALFERILQNELPIFFDYESTGLKPTRIGQKVVMLGIALSTDEAYAIPVKWKTIWTAQELRYIISTFRLILSNKNIRKSAHNIKFEDFWSFGFFGTRIANVEWCSMMGAHILDNRRAWSALKFQTYIQFGVRPYDDHIKHFLKSKETEFNEVEKAPFKDIAIYCGLDCIFGLMLKSDQQEQFALDQNKGMLRAFNFFKKGLGIMSEMQINGARSNIEYYTEAQEKLGKDIEALGEKLMASREARAFKEIYHREINIGSDQDIGALYFEVLKHKGLKTAKGNWKTDKLSLGRIKIDFSKDLGEYKKLTKMYDTYFKQYMSETCYGRIHPFFDLHVPISYRSSSSRPNFQNTPKRDAVAKKLIRTGIEPDPGSVLIECDFSGAEVNTSCAYHRDKNFYNYLIDPTTDMHRDSACDIFKLSPEDLNHPDFTKEMKKLAKKIRNEAKNKWVFAQFYGDWYDSCGRALYENCYKIDMMLPSGILLSEHMDNNGIGELEDFLEHCKEAERIMWMERFPEYTQWKKDIYEFYIKHGYIDTYLGFRFQGYMDRKAASNYPIQSTSFHLLVHTLIQVSAMIKKLRLKSKLIMQIHDSLIASVPVSEIGVYLANVNRIVENLHNIHKWMNVPMKIEADMSRPLEDGGNFNEMFTVPETMMNGKIDLKRIYGVK